MIGIAGKMGTGKTTLAKMLVCALGPGWERVSFGDAVKAEASTVFNFPIEWCYTEVGKAAYVPTREVTHEVDSMTVRRIMQYWGAKRRSEDPDYWVKAFDRTGVHPKMIFDDVRHKNEYEYIDSRGGYSVRILPYPGWESRGAASNDISETALDGYVDWDMLFHPAYGGLERVQDAILEYLHPLG